MADRADERPVREDLDDEEHASEQERHRYQPETAVPAAWRSDARFELALVRLDDLVVLHQPSLPSLRHFREVTCGAANHRLQDPIARPSCSRLSRLCPLRK